MAATALINIDVDDLERAVSFYTAAFGLKVGRRLGPSVVELLGADRRSICSRKRREVLQAQQLASVAATPGIGPRCISISS